MKRLMILLLFLNVLGCGGTKFYFMGVDTDIIKDARARDWAYVGLGVASSFAAHAGGHWVFGEVFGVEFEYRDFYTKEHVTNAGEYSDSDARWFGRGGFVLQHSIGLALTSFEATRYSYYTKGYVGHAALQTWTYQFVDSDYNDLKWLDDHGGDGDLEWGIYSLVALHNVLRVPWKGEDNVRRNLGKDNRGSDYGYRFDSDESIIQSGIRSKRLQFRDRVRLLRPMLQGPSGEPYDLP